MWKGVGADGVVDLRSTVLSGTVKTGSAGLFTLFFGFGIVIFVLATVGAKASTAGMSQSQRQSRTHYIARAFWVVLAATLAAGFAGALGLGPGFGLLTMMLGMLLVGVGGAYLVNLD